jgi:hypothetical protein
MRLGEPMSQLTPEQLAESDRVMWLAIGMARRLNELQHRMHQEAVDGKHITVYADGELIGALNLDFAKEEVARKEVTQ